MHLSDGKKFFIAFLLVSFLAFVTIPDMSNYVLLSLSNNSIVVFVIIPFIVIFIFDINNFSFYSLIRYKMKSYVANSLKTYLYSFQMVLIYFFIIVILNDFKINFISSILFLIIMSLVNFAIYILILSLNVIGVSKYYSIILGILYWLIIMLIKNYYVSFIIDFSICITIFTISVVFFVYIMLHKFKRNFLAELEDDTYLAITNLSVKDIISHVNLSFKIGSINLINGANGSGKSIMLKTIVGEKSVSSGSLVFNSRFVNDIDGKRGTIGYLSNDNYFNDKKSGLDNLKELLKITKSKNDKRLEKLLDIFDMEYCIEKKVSMLSSCEKKKLGIIQAIMEDQELIVLDDPLIGLDNASIKIVCEIIEELKTMKKTIIVASNINSDINDLADRIIKMVNGIVVSDDVNSIGKNSVSQ